MGNVLEGRLLREPCCVDDGCPESEEPFDGGETCARELVTAPQ